MAMHFQFRPSDCPRLGLSGSAKVDGQPFEINVPGTCRPQIDGEISSVNPEYSSPTGDRLSDSKGMGEERMR